MANATPPTTPTTPLLLLRGAPNERKTRTTATTKKKKKKPLRDRAFEKCSSLLRRLLRHRHAWLFDAPVDVRGLGLRDYYAVIRSPMDLGTVRARLEKGRYRSPGAFAADVRLTFRNAMAYNFRGDDAYAMAEELSEVFETRWAEIEDEFGDALDSLGSAAAAAEAEDSSSLDLMVLEGNVNEEEAHEVV
ncbi:Transcription factor GTE4 [Ananas comosus]|uniref:Transcription factor GTE4 n=1 Tax=Ananas comosus TaxID=4615 RepID=A0A199UNZ6_ANACO|nr:Transcription factor GTE4 [Ananas comosus]